MQGLHGYFENKTHVIWDWNGTLLSDLELAVVSVNRLLSEENLPAVTVEEYREVFGFPVINYYKKLGFSTEPEAFAELCRRFNEHFHSGIVDCEMWPGARETLAFVKASGRRQSILSASEQRALDRQMLHFEIGHHFDHVFGLGDQRAGSKIDRGRELIDTSGVPRELTMMIGDTDHDHEVAAALGIDLVLVDHGHQTAERLRRVHPRVVNAFK